MRYSGVCRVVARRAGRSGRPTIRLFAKVREQSDICCYCGHPGARQVNHNEPLSKRPDLALDPANLAVIHGWDCPCPICPWRWSVKHRRLMPANCNGILGAKRLADAHRGEGWRAW